MSIQFHNLIPMLKAILGFALQILTMLETNK